MSQIIPTFDTPFYAESVALDGVNYTLDFRYNTREDCWYLSIATYEGVDLVNGIKLVCQISLLAKWADNRLPPGLLFCMAGGKDNSPAKLHDLADGGRCQLVYFPLSQVLTGVVPL